jgi:hypothetical protein
MISSFSNEPALRDELTKIDSRQAEIEAELDRVRALKQILYLKDKPLETEVVRFLSEELSIPARHAGGTDEDFWLVDSDDGDWAIGEVKASASGSVDRQQIGKLDGHRKEAGRPDDFPALLVANTVHKRQTIEGRDEPIAPDIVKRATTDHVLVVRTLDLFRLKQLEVRGHRATDRLVEAIRGGGGWFEVDANLSIDVHSG